MTDGDVTTYGRHRGGAGSHSSRTAARRIGRIVAASVSMLLFVAFGYGFYNYRDLTSNQQTAQISGLGKSTPTSGQSATVQHVDGSAENILIVGLDSRAGLTQAEQAYLKVGGADATTSTDTIIVLHVPADGKQATLLSIPRDTYVQIPGYQPAKINAAFADGYYDGGGTTAKQDEANGASLLVTVVKNLTGLEIDHYVQVGFGGFVNIVKAIGTVPIDLCESVDDTSAYNASIGVSGGSGFKMSAGEHNLTPQEALEFVRQRHNIPGPVSDDLGREARQRYFLKQAFNEIATAGVLLNPIKLHNLITAIDGAFTFDNNNFGIQQFAAQMSDLTSNNITGESIPITGYPTIDGQSVISVNIAAVQAAVQKLFYGSGTTTKPSTSASSSTPSSTTSSSTSKSAAPATDPAASGCIY